MHLHKGIVVMPLTKKPGKDPREPLLRLGGKKWNLKIYTPLGLVFFCFMIALGVWMLTDRMDMQMCIGKALTASSDILPPRQPR